jgi:hypothetical protein
LIISIADLNSKKSCCFWVIKGYFSKKASNFGIIVEVNSLTELTYQTTALCCKSFFYFSYSKVRLQVI